MKTEFTQLNLHGLDVREGMKYMGKKKNAFTLIELIAVLVILAIIALIVTPLVMNIVKKAKDSANKRSVDAYGKAVELGVATYLLDNGDYPTDLNGINVQYSGNEVVCTIQTLNEDGSIYLSECSVKGRDVKDSSTDDGWYHYGKTSSTAYQSYVVGDIIIYNGMNFYVIEDSDEASDHVTMLKAEPLTVDEVNKYGVGHVNRYTSSSIGTAYNINNTGYGVMAYYTSETCGYVNGSEVNTGCTTDYDKSEVKYVVDAWTNDILNVSDLKEDSLGYKTRLITYEEYMENCEITQGTTPSGTYEHYVPQYDWMYNNDYGYWLMSSYNDSDYQVWQVSNYRGGDISDANVNNHTLTVRPVVTILKSAIN